MKRLGFAAIIAITVVSVASMLALFAVKPAHAAINPQISFQGKLTNTDGTNVTDGPYSIRFRIYTSTAPTDATNACSANSCLWEETQGSVTVTGGLFQVNLGSVTALPGSVDFNSTPLYLGVKVGSDTEMAPRIQFTAAPFAFNADKLDGIDSAGFVQLSPGSQQTGNINISGTITSGAVNGITVGSTIKPSAAGALTVQSNGSNALTLTGGAASTWDIGANTLSLQTANNGAITTGTGTLTQGGNVTFSGTSARTLTGPSTGGLTVTVASGPLAISTTTSGTLSATSAGALNLTAAAASTWDIGNNTLSLQTTNNGAITTGTGLLTQGGNITFGGTTARTITGPSTGGLTINVTSGPLTLSTTTSGTLTIQGSAAVAITSGANITLGAVDGTGTLLVLDTKNTTGDPTEVDGGMYYNSTNNRYRCGENGAWINCIGGTMATNTAASSAVNTCTAACASFSTNAALPANFCVPGRMFHVVANGVYTSAASLTVAMGVYIGTNAATKTSDTLIGAASGTLTSGAAVTNQGWNVDFYISCFTTGTSGTVSGQGNFSMATNNTTTLNSRMYLSTNTTINTTVAQNIYLFPAFGTSAAGDTATVQQFVVTAM